MTITVSRIIITVLLLSLLQIHTIAPIAFSLFDTPNTVTTRRQKDVMSSLLTTMSSGVHSVGGLRLQCIASTVQCTHVTRLQHGTDAMTSACV